MDCSSSDTHDTRGQCRDAPAHDVHGLEDVQLENQNSEFTVFRTMSLLRSMGSQTCRLSTEGQ